MQAGCANASLSTCKARTGNQCMASMVHQHELATIVPATSYCRTAELNSYQNCACADNLLHAFPVDHQCSHGLDKDGMVVAADHACTPRMQGAPMTKRPVGSLWNRTGSKLKDNCRDPHPVMPMDNKEYVFNLVMPAAATQQLTCMVKAVTYFHSFREGVNGSRNLISRL